MNRVGGAGRNQPDVGDRAGGPCVPFVDRVAVLVEQQAPIEMGAWLDGPFAAVLDRSAVQDRAAVVVRRFELDPDVERVDRAAREEVTDLARADHDLDADRLAAPDGGQPAVDLVERRDHLYRRSDEVLRGAEARRLLADRESARDLRLRRT